MPHATFTPLRRINVPNGDVLHALKATEQSFVGFGEAYFSIIHPKAIKGWKRHNRMTLNLIVPCGEIQISIHDDRRESTASYRLGPDRSETYGRLTIEPGLWVAFGGIGDGLNVMLNISDIPHDPSEADALPLNAIEWKWE